MEPPSRGVVADGPVGSRHARRFRMFRYEPRRWREGVIQATAFTPATYVHLLPDDLPDPCFLDELTAEPSAEEATEVATQAAETRRDDLAAVE